MTQTSPENEPKYEPLPDIGVRNDEILTLRSEGRSLSDISSRFNLSKEGVRQIIKRRPESDANKQKRDQAYAQLEAVCGVACIEAGMSVTRLAGITGTTPGRVEQWLQLNGIAKYC
jgi:hypothetical protein